MFKLVSILASYPELTVLLARSGSTHRDEFLNFGLYNFDYHSNNNYSRDLFSVTCKLFKIDESSFLPFKNNPCYPSLIHLDFGGEYHGVIFYLNVDKIYYMDYNDSRSGKEHIIFSLSESEMISWMKIIKNPSLLEWKKFLEINYECNNAGKADISIAQITDYYKEDELLNLMDQQTKSIIDYCIIKPHRLYQHELDYNLAYPLIKELIVDESDEQLLIGLIKYSFNKNLKILKDRISKMYRWT